MDTELNRRRLLQFVGIGALGAVSARTAASPPRRRHNIGTRSRRAERAAQEAADTVHRVLDFGDRGKTISGKFPEEALEALERRPDVRYVEPDGQYQAIGETLPWGVDRIDADVAHDAGETGGDNTDGEGGADVAIIDSGIDDDHPDLQANVGDGVAYTDCEGTNCTYDWSDDNGHGTHCAGIAGAVDNSRGTIGVAPGVTLHGVKVLASDGYGYYSDIAAGVRWVADKGYEVASLSLGGSSSSSTLRDACEYAVDEGVLVVAAAGNEGPCSDCVLYPARYSSVVAVSATDRYDDLASFSSTGPEIELAAPGRYIYSTVPGGYESWSGTSMACPHVSGAGGQLMDNGYTNTEARAKLRETAEDIGLASNDGGSGLLDVEAALAESSDPSVAVSTVGASDVGETTATLEGSLDDLGGASSADVAFEYRRSGASTWSTSQSETRSNAGSFSRDVSDLDSGTEYEFRARADASDGDAATGSTLTLTTDTEPVLAVSTIDSPTVGETTATLEGSLDDLGGATSAEVGFEYRQSGASSWSATALETLSSTGNFTRDLSGLESDTEYEFRAVADASDGDSNAGSTRTFTTTTDPSVAVSTVGSSSVGETTATLEGSLDDLGGASSADVGFEYRQSGANSWSATAPETLSSTGRFTRNLSGLESGADYEFRATADASDDDTDIGSTLAFTTATDPSVAVSTTGSSSMGETSATLEGSLDDLGGASSADVGFEYRQSGANTWSATALETLSSMGSFTRDLSGLESGTDYEFRAVATASDGDTDAGSVASFSTDASNGTAPTIERWSATTADSRNPHAEITVTWDVSDEDGDLTTVTSTVEGGNSITTTVGGGAASGTHEHIIKHGAGSSYTVTLTVTDSTDLEASDSMLVDSVRGGGGKGGGAGKSR